MNAVQIVKNFVGNDSVEDIIWGSLYNKSTAELENGMVISITERKGGSEGQGEYTHVVFKIQAPDDVKYVKVTGRYDSYNGTEWDDEYFEVKPTEKIIIVFDPV